MRVLLALVLSLGMAVAAVAQEAALVADRILINADETLTAEGNVVIYYEGARLTASRVTYSRDGDRLVIEGPMVLTDETGQSTLIADSAELDPQLKAGVLRSARLVLADQLQLAAAQINVLGGRYTQLTRTVASSCRVCADSPTPMWEIRASKVVHDAEARQLYFSNAQLRLMGLPVLYIPRLRLPDPSLDRAAGFLVPEIQTSSRLGTGIRAPYFQPFGPHADITVAPYVSTSTSTLETAFRMELPAGRLSFDAAVSSDDIEPGTRGYFFGEALFLLPRGFQLEFDLELVTDDSYLLDYGYSDKDRLDSGARLYRTRDRDNFEASITSFRTLRASEVAVDNELPNEVIDLTYTRRLGVLPGLGEVWGSLGSMSLERPSSTPTTGRDVARLSFGVEADNSWVFGPGLVAETRLGFDAEQYLVSQDPDFPGTITRTTPSAAVALRWPLARTAEDGARHLLEPALQLAWSDPKGGPVPNEDSTVVEFDEGNLLSLTRYPGIDKRERGLRLNAGLGWTRRDPDGWSVAMTAGRVLRFSAKDQFNPDTGLSGSASDWILAAQYALDDRLLVTGRTVFDDDLTFARGETRVGWSGARADIGATYLWIAANPDEGRPDNISELALDTTYRIDPNWTASLDWRFEADAGRTTQAGVGLRYQNECIGLDLSLSRRFTSSAIVEPLTDVAFRVFLTGFGTGVAGAPGGSCKGL